MVFIVFSRELRQCVQYLCWCLYVFEDQSSLLTMRFRVGQETVSRQCKCRNSSMTPIVTSNHPRSCEEFLQVFNIPFLFPYIVKELFFSWIVVVNVFVWFGFFFLWHNNLHGLLNAKAILIEDQLWYNIAYSWVSYSSGCNCQIAELRLRNKQVLNPFAQ